MNFGHHPQHRRRAEGISQPPAGHGICFRKTADQNRAFLHTVDFRDRNMPLSPEGQLGVNFIRKHHDVGIPQNSGNRLQILAAHDRAGRVAGEGKDQQPGFRRNGCPQFLRSQAEMILRPGVEDDRHTAGHAGQRLVADKAGLNNQHFIPRTDQGADGAVDRLTSADGDQNLVRRIVGEAVFPLHISGDLPPQLLQPPVGGVPGLPILQGGNTGAADMPGRAEIRLAHAKGDDVVHFLGDIKEFSDTGRLDVAHRGVQNFIIVHHRDIFPLSSVLSSQSLTFCSLYRRSTKWVAVEMTDFIGASSLATNIATS